jgi:hypothetical protein
MPIDLTFGDPQVDQETAERTWMGTEVDMPWKLEDPRKRLEMLLEWFLRGPLGRYRAAFPHTSIVPINYEVGSPVIPLGEQYAYQGVLNNIPVAVEEELSWGQVRQFRDGPEARRKYRDLHLWLSQGLHAESERHATDLIGQKLDDYRWAIGKHGLSTANEAISSLISLGTVVPAAGGVAAAAMHVGPLWGALAGGVLAVSGAAAWVAKRLLALEDVKRGPHREVAYLYEIQTLPPPNG